MLLLFTSILMQPCYQGSLSSYKCPVLTPYLLLLVLSGVDEFDRPYCNISEMDKLVQLSPTYLRNALRDTQY